MFCLFVFSIAFCFQGKKKADGFVSNHKTTAVNSISFLSRTFEGYSHQPCMPKVLQNWLLVLPSYKFIFSFRQIFAFSVSRNIFFMQQHVAKGFVCSLAFQSLLRDIAHIFSTRQFKFFLGFFLVMDTWYFHSTTKHFRSVSSYKGEGLQT